MTIVGRFIRRSGKAGLALLCCSLALLLFAVDARAQGCIDGACITVGSNLASVDTTQSELLDGILSGLLDTQVDVNVGNYNELINGSVGLVDLLEELRVDLGLQDVNQVLSADITLGQLLNAVLEISEDNDLDLAINDLLLDLVDLTGTFQLGDLLQLELGTDSLSNVDLNLLDLLTGSIQLFNFANVDGPTTAIELNGADLLGVGNVGKISLIVRALEPPTFICGPEGATFNTAPLRILLDVELLNLGLDTSSLTTDLLGGLGSLLSNLIPGLDLNLISVDVDASLAELSLLIETGRGEGVIETIDRLNNAVTVQATPGLANIYLGDIDPTLALSRTYTLSASDVQSATIGSVGITVTFSGLLDLLGYQDINVANVAIYARGIATGDAPTPQALNFTGPYPQTLVATGSATYVSELLSELLGSLEIGIDVSVLNGAVANLNLLSTLVNTLLNGLLDTLQTADTGVLDPILDLLLGDVVDPLLDGLGISLGEMGVTVNGIVDLCPDLTITKSHTGNFSVGVNNSYSIVVQNVGKAPTAAPITVIDTLPAGMGFVSASGDGWSLLSHIGQSVALQHNGVISPGQSLPLLTLTVNPSTAGTVINQAEVTVTGDSSAANNVASDQTIVTAATGSGAPDLIISKSHTGDFTAGGLFDYTINVQNNGPGVTTGDITVVDTLPAGMSYVSHSGPGWQLVSATGQNVTLRSQGVIAAGNSLPPLVLRVSVGPDAIGTPINMATVSTPGETNTLNNSATDPTVVNPGTALPPPDLTISKSHTGDFMAGGIFTYIIAGSNIGSGPTTGPITVMDTLPAGMSYFSHSGDGWTLISNASGIVTLQHPGPVAAGAALPSLTIQVLVGSEAVGTVVNSVSIATPADANDANNTANDSTVVNPASGGPAPDLTIDLSHTGTFTQGVLQSYLIDVDNVGNGPTTGPVLVADSLPVGVSYVSHSGQGWELVETSGNVVTFENAMTVASNGSLPPLTLNVVPSSLGTITNTAIVATAGDANAANNSDTDITTVVGGSNDDDGDGIPNDDECPDRTNCPDTDDDGDPNHQDPDDDGDGIPTSNECPNYPNCPDSDDDGTPDYLDPDDDGDGVPTRNECPNFPNCPDTDGDGTPDYLDPDDDGDGVPTRNECPNFPNCPDTDGDGTPDYLDSDDDGDGILTRNECPNYPNCPDNDGDTIPDYLDRDDDGDSVFTRHENPDPNGDGNGSDGQDTDGDGVPDYLDPNDDGDSKPTITESPDPNGDGDPEDAIDSDSDSIPDYLDPADNVAGIGGGRVLIPLVMLNPEFTAEPK
jgi:uncharacterized repeat protein (TIGR01451 family)